MAYLSAVLTGFSLLMNFVLQKLGIILSDKELAKLKEATLLKQVLTRQRPLDFELMINSMSSKQVCM